MASPRFSIHPARRHEKNEETLCYIQGSHYILVLKFKDFSRTFKDPEVAFSRTNYSRQKFTAWTVLEQHAISKNSCTFKYFQGCVGTLHIPLPPVLPYIRAIFHLISWQITDFTESCHLVFGVTAAKSRDSMINIAPCTAPLKRQQHSIDVMIK